MKCELLKRTAIALFVGSVVSTYAMAEDDTLVDATNNLKNAIKQEVKIQTEASKAEQDKNIQRVKDAVSDLATGIDDALLPAIATNRTDIDKNTSNIKNLATGIRDGLVPAIEANRTDIDKNTSNIKNLATGIRDGLVPAIEANRTDIDANKAALDTKADKSEFKKFADQTNANAALLITMAGKVDQNKQDVEALQSDMEKAATAVSTLSDNVKELNSAQNDINENFNNQLLAANQTLDEHQAEIEKIKNLQGYDSLTKVENIVSNKADQDYVEGLEQDVKINTSDIKELSKGIRDNILPALEANRTDIDKNASRITDTRNKQVLQNARLDNHGERIEANKAALESKADKTALAAKADKTALEAKADKTALEAKADKTALEAKADKVYVGSLEQNIRDNSNRIETNKVNVSALRNDINSHAKRLDHLDNRVNKLDKDLKRGLAAQAALTGLFQPYTVGKANFTAAVGGYKSQTAVAIGTGYRYTQNIATKAGVAFTQGGGVTYNAGVNFEW